MAKKINIISEDKYCVVYTCTICSGTGWNNHTRLRMVNMDGMHMGYIQEQCNMCKGSGKALSYKDCD